MLFDIIATGPVVAPISDIAGLVTQVALSVISLLVTAGLGFGLQFLRTKLSASQFQLLQDIAYTAVHTAEQTSLNGSIEDKKGYALSVAAQQLSKAGIKVSAEMLDHAIEAAVSEAFNANTAPGSVNVDAGPDGEVNIDTDAS